MRVPSDSFSVRVAQLNGVARFRLAGRFDVMAIPALDEAIGQLRRRDVVLDLKGVTAMDSAAWLAVVAYEHRVHDAWGRELRLVNTPAHIRRIFELTASEYLLSEVVSA
jgi:anti-anti-sigma factor